MRLTLLKDQVTETYFMSAVIFVQNWKYIIIIIITAQETIPERITKLKNIDRTCHEVTVACYLF